MVLPCLGKWGRERAHLSLICFLSPRDKMVSLKSCLSEPGLEVVPVPVGWTETNPKFKVIPGYKAAALGYRRSSLGSRRPLKTGGKACVCEN